MLVKNPTGYAFNRTRQVYLAARMSVAATHFSRLCGLMGTAAADFPPGQGLWIVPCRGIHTFAMNFPIDAVYLDSGKRVVYMAHHLRPWRMARVILRASSVLELPGDTLQASGTSVGDEIEIVLGGPRTTSPEAAGA